MFSTYLRLESYTILEDGYFAVSVLLVACLFSTCNGNHLVDELVDKCKHVGTLYKFACIEVNPVWLVLVQVAVCGNLHCRDEGAEWRSASCSEQYYLAT